MTNKIIVQILGIFLINFCGLLSGLKAAPGDLDTTFASTGFVREASAAGSNDRIVKTKIQPDGKIVAIGAVNYGLVSNGVTFDCSLVRYNADGSLDASFDGDGKTTVPMGFEFNCQDVALQADGKIVIAGYTVKNSVFNWVVVRYLADGSLDTSFDGDGLVITYFNNGALALGLAIQTDGKIVVCGVDGNDIGVARYNTDGSPDNSFDGDGKVSTDFNGFTDHARTVVIQPDGKIVVAGNTVGTANDFAVVRYHADGSLDTSFDNDGKASADIQGGNDNVRTIVLQTDGKIVAGGETFNSGFYFALARFNADGTPDNSFDGDGRLRSGLNMSLFDLALQSDGKIVTAGGLQSQILVARYNADGSPDNSFDGDGRVLTTVLNNSNAYAVAIHSDGKIVAAGAAGSAVTGDTYKAVDFALVRLNTDGSLDSSFDGDGKVSTNFRSWKISAHAVAVQPDGKIIAVGEGYNSNGFDVFILYRYNADGTPDNTFDGDGKAIAGPFTSQDKAFSVAVQPDGKIIVGGRGYQDALIARFNPNGSLDTSFNNTGRKLESGGSGGFDTVINSIVVQADGKILAAGSMYNTFSVGWDFTIFRYNPDGSRDNSFDGDGKVQTDFSTAYSIKDAVTSIVIQPDGKIVAAGVSGAARNSTDITNSDFAIARYNTDGSLDTSFDGDGKATTEFTGGNDVAKALAMQADGKIVVAGGSSDDSALVRYNPDGTLDSSFDGDGKVRFAVSNFFDTATGVVIQTDGKIVTSGYAFNISRNDLFPANHDIVIARYNPNGSTDGTYASNGRTLIDLTNNDFANGIALDSAGRFVIAGETDGLFTVARVLGGASNIIADSPYDFDGDGKTDISIYRPSVGEWWINRSSTGQTVAAQFGNSSDQIVPGDFSGDGKADIAVWRGSTGEWLILRSEDASYYSIPFGTAGDVPVPADFDSDGITDIAIYRPSTFTWYINQSSGGTQIVTFGAAGDVPVVGDYDGDGKADLAVFRPAAGEWWINRSATSSTAVFQFGNSADRPVQGDYTGDGKADIAVWRGSTGSWFILRSEDNSFYETPFGATGDIPIPGDYDGDGRFDTAVFRPSSANWYINRSTSGILITAFGVTGDKPVPSAFLP